MTRLCVVISTLAGDFLSPCPLTALDGGRAMTEGLNKAKIEYVMLGNHELDYGFQWSVDRMQAFKGKVGHDCLDCNCSRSVTEGLRVLDALMALMALMALRGCACSMLDDLLLTTYSRARCAMRQCINSNITTKPIDTFPKYAAIPRVG
jgi:hypothetical protein